MPFGEVPFCDVVKRGNVWNGFRRSDGGVKDEGSGFRGSAFPLDCCKGSGESGGTLMIVGDVPPFCSSISPRTAWCPCRRSLYGPRYTSRTRPLSSTPLYRSIFEALQSGYDLYTEVMQLLRNVRRRVKYELLSLQVGRTRGRTERVQILAVPQLDTNKSHLDSRPNCEILLSAVLRGILDSRKRNIMK